MLDCAVIGAGQAGLATSYHLSRLGVEHVVLERGRVAETWRTARWDSFHLNTPNWCTQLPGLDLSGADPNAFAPLAEIVETFEGYADAIGAPVRTADVEADEAEIVAIGDSRNPGHHLAIDKSADEATWIRRPEHRGIAEAGVPAFDSCPVDKRFHFALSERPDRSRHCNHSAATVPGAKDSSAPR